MENKKGSWMLFLISNWKTIVAIMATAALCYLLHALDVDRLEKKEAADINNQQVTDTKSCNADKAITEKVSHDYEDKISSLNKQLVDLTSVRPNVCVTIPSRTAPRSNAASRTAIARGPDARVDSDALYIIAGQGEKYRLQLISCQQFITDTWQEQAAKQQ